jgi:hypothetical protein
VRGACTHGSAAALRSGTFELRPERRLSSSPLVLDEQGWAEVTQLLAEVLGLAEGIAERSGRRLEVSGGASISTRLMMLHFEFPP